MIGRIFTPKEAEETVHPSGFDAYDLRLGDVMRGERATLGKSLQDVQRELKIKATYVAAIENADPSAFESPSFIAGYVRSYARYLGMDPEWAFQKFCDESDYETAHGMSAQASSTTSQKTERVVQNRDPLADPNATFLPRKESFFSGVEINAIGSMMVLVALIGGIGYGGWTVLQEVQRVQFAPVEQAPGLATAVDPLAGREDVLAMSEEETTGFVAPSPDALDRLYRPQALEVPVMVARDGPIAALNPDSFGTLAPDTSLSAPELRRVMAGLDQPDLSPEPTDPTLIKVVEDGVPEVAIFAVREAWVRVKSADGTVIYEKVMQPGDKFVLPKTEEPPTLRTGYAGGVYFAVNGKTYGPAGDGPSVVSKVALGEGEITEKYALADLTQNAELAKVVAELSVDPAKLPDE
ncbi:helix-turn-helix domain-containing protein [Profundibacter sp.]|uniref:helix-turn-helix domain-containing protein n=1 Tax=Profundibacter sp. TaxID=3101071 RepID=UPI003D118437